MSAVVERPQTKFVEPIDYFDKRVIGANVVRYVFFAGDLIVPQRKKEISWLEKGGEETPSPCIQAFGRGFVPRGRAALLALGGEPIPMQHLGDMQASAWTGIPLNEGLAKNNFGFVPVYPGDGLKVLRRYSMNDNSVGGMRKGMDEITVLRGKEYEETRQSYNYCPTCQIQYPVTITTCPVDTCKGELKAFHGNGILDIIEREMYGDGLEKTLKGLEAQIANAHVTESRIDIGKYKSECLAMCEDFRNWASAKIGIEHGLLRQGTKGDWAYAYSPITEMLLEQLEIPRQDQPLQEMAKMFSANFGNQPAGISALDMDLIDRRFEEKLESRLSAASQRIAELEAQLAAKPETEAQPYTCEHCGEEMKATAKGIHLSRWCKVLHPTETE